ncbi:MAG: magnesium transporter CorA family protein [Victivallaceae bacterium]|jgi:magnesium transporter
MKTYLRIKDGKLLPDADGGEVILYEKPMADELMELEKVHEIDEHDLRSATDKDEIGRLEYQEKCVIIILKVPKNYSAADNLLFKVLSIGLFVFKDKLIIITAEHVSLFESKMSNNIKTVSDVLIKIIHTAIDHFISHLKIINMISDEIETKLNQSMDNKYFLNMFTLEKSLVYFLNAINDNSTVLDKLKVNAARIGFSQDNIETLDDIMIDNKQCQSLADTYTNILSGLMDARGSVVGNNLNVMMKNLNALVIAIALPTFFTGVGGMSELTGMCESIGVRPFFGYLAFFVSMVIFGATVFIFIRKFDKIWR